ncbi:MAG: LysR family transcriptional regulator [Mycolicibacterium neoaurum]|uniref:LysR family transcriptional regulator n=1 Tax=Mycolicibacterium neoaurum TaxID=1795 RepID=A0AAV2WJW5_MYCNE|nr:LysR family transcriptional regulator [Mycolicibacterium neoaurum]TLH61487.1 LysR family transcriptional regulator [Mycolicibacterium neoaurum]CDQ44457.1 LysR family transcriptional regulator [Mycolicibacterium neoaurum]
MNLSGVDLNLLVVLHAVLQERSATKAATRLHLTQPAVSNALSRLRVLLGDPLVVRSGRGLTPTPAALAIQPRLDAALQLVEGIVRDLDDFDLTTTTREWVIAFADLYGPLVLPGLDRLLQQRAPGSAIRVAPLDRISVVDALATGEIDLYLGIPTTIPSAWHSEPAFVDDMVGVMSAHRPDAGIGMTLERFVELPHAHVQISPGRGREVDDALGRLGHARRICFTVSHYSSLFPIVENGRCIAVAPRRLARHHAQRSAITLFDLPLTLPSYEVRLFWHERVDNDPGIAALRAVVRDVLDALPPD